ncbi:energy transducer TonB [Chryseobacterium sp. T1]
MSDNIDYNPSNLNLDEIVFKNRNKEYGAYDLRTMYPRLLTKSFVIGTAFFVLAIISPFVYLKIQKMNAEEQTNVQADLIDILPDQPVLEQPKEEEPPPPPPKQEEEKIEIIQNVVPEPKREPKIETPPPTITEQKETTTGLVAQEGVKQPAYVTPPPVAPPGKGTAVEVKAVNSNEVYDSVDQSAEYPGGLNAVRKLIGENVDSSGLDGEGQLTVKLRFIVERDGTVSDVKVTSKSGNSDFDSESVRAVKRLKKWVPAKKNGETVRSYYSIPVTMQFQ